MVTAEETVVATTTMEADPQTDTSGNSSDSDADKIEKLKAEQREIAGIEAENGSEDVTNRNTIHQKNGDSVELIAEVAAEVSSEINSDETVDEVAPQLEAEGAVDEENGDTSVVEELATTSTPDDKEADAVEEMEVEEVKAGNEEEANGNNAPVLTEETSKEEESTESAAPTLESESDPDAIMEVDSKQEVPKPEETETAELEDDCIVEEDDQEVITLADDGDSPQVIEEVQEVEEAQEGKGVKRAVDCIQLDDDDDEIQEVTPNPPKKAKVESDSSTSATPSTSTTSTTSADSDKVKKEEVKKEEVEDDNTKAQERLLNKLVDYVNSQKVAATTQNRKVLDTLLGAINAQVQKEPLSVRKLILDKDLVLPNTISFPPSQVCDILIEHDPEMPLAKAITRMFGDEKPKLSDSEKREKAMMKNTNPTPNMTKLLVDIGQDLVQEATYCDIVHAKNLPEVPKNLETYKQVAAQLKPVWETLKRKNEPYKLKLQRCKVCGFQTESLLQMANHKATIHYTGSKYQCTYCKEFDNSEQRMKDHMFEAHLVIATPEEKEAKYPCAICEEDFNFKGVREQHYKTCKKDYIRLRNIMMPKPEDHLLLNRWLWEKPTMDPSILQQQQQQAAREAQQRKQQIINQQNAAAALIRKQQQLAQQQALAHQNRVRENQQQQAQQFRQLTQMMQRQGNNISNTLIAAMQAQIRRGAQPANSAAATNLVMSQMMQKQLAAAMKSQAGAAQIQAAVAAAAMKSQSQKMPLAQKMQKVLGTTQSSLSSSPASSSSATTAAQTFSCEICDQTVVEKERYLLHLQGLHKQMTGKCLQDMAQGAPLACSRCRDRFWTYEGLERHLVMSHGLVTADLLQKAQKKEDGGRCKTCGKQYAFNMLQHLVADHQVKLCSAEIMYSCDVCAFKCSSYQILEAHLTSTHPKGSDKKTTPKKDDCIVLDD